MPAYEWTCSSCGHANDPGPATCSSCSCPSTATLKQIVEFREKFASHGGTVLATAARVNDPDGQALLAHVGKALSSGAGWLGWLAWLWGISKL